MWVQQTALVQGLAPSVRSPCSLSFRSTSLRHVERLLATVAASIWCGILKAVTKPGSGLVVGTARPTLGAVHCLTTWLQGLLPALSETAAYRERIGLKCVPLQLRPVATSPEHWRCDQGPPWPRGVGRDAGFAAQHAEKIQTWKCLMSDI